MDTRLKSFTRSNVAKALAFLIVVAFVASISGTVTSWYYSGINPEVLLTEDYRESEEYRSEVSGIGFSLMDVMVGEKDVIPPGIRFYGKIGDETISWPGYIREETFTRGEGEYYFLEEGVFKSSLTDETVNMFGYLPEGEALALFSFETEYLNHKQQQWSSDRETLMPLARRALLMLAGIMVLLVYLFAVTGRKAEDEELHMSSIDRVYGEIPLLALPFMGFAWLASISSALYRGWGSYPLSSAREAVGIYLIMALTALATAITGIILLSFARRIKGQGFLKSFLVYKSIHGIWAFFRSFMDGSRYKDSPLTFVLYKRQVYFIAGSFALVFLTFVLVFAGTPLFIVPPLLEIVLIYWYLKYNGRTFLEINKGFDRSLKEQLKAERMKINLVTNVSHDLKTPLTSIISYVDLLSREEDLSPVSRDYVRILSEKSERLNNIVSDLFDLAKSTSGDIGLDLETLDLKKLVEQTVVDMDDSVKSSGLVVKMNLPHEPVQVVSDGKKLYRVIQNLLDNALKYSLEGTRIFVDLHKSDGQARVQLQNTAGYEMNFTKEEILQRFFRGEESRTGEGSGLGLSIAESFTNVCGGRFNIHIDGDQFKVVLEFPLEEVLE